MIRRAALALALALAACKSGSGSPSLRLDQPSGLAVFWGYTERHSGESTPYVAVANSGRDELVLLDAVEDVAVASTIAIRPLSIPVPDPRPALVVSARLADDDPAVLDSHGHVMQRPDLLVASSAGSSVLQLVRTWRTATTLGAVPAPGVLDAQAVDLGRPVQAVVAVPAVDASGNVVRGQVWVVAAVVPASGQGSDLVVVRYGRKATAAEPDAIAPLDAGVAATQHLAFEVRALAGDPSTDPSVDPQVDARAGLRNPRYLYAASADPIPDAGGVLGVGELDLVGGPGAFGVRGLDARVPTRLVAGFTLAERNPDQRGSYDQVFALPKDTECTPSDPASCGRDAFRGNGADVSRRVYAVIDETACGDSEAIGCGIAVIDPGQQPTARFGQLLANPFLGASSQSAAMGRAHDDAAEPYLPPIAIPSLPIALVPITPPRNTPDSARTYLQAPFMSLAPYFRPRVGTGVLGVVTAAGPVYLVDLARWELLSDPYALRTSTELQVSSVSIGSTTIPQIGFYQHDDITGSSTFGTWVLRADRVGAQSALFRDPAAGAQLVPAVTLGYTPDEVWTVTYQGLLPGFNIARPVEVQAGPAASTLRVAFQARAAGGAITQVVRTSDPNYALRVGDIVQLYTRAAQVGSAGACPRTETSTDEDPIEPFEGQVLSIDPPDADHPGGSLVLGKPEILVKVDGSYTKGDDTAQRYWSGNDPEHPERACQAALAVAAPAHASSTAVIRTRGWDPADPDPASPHHEFLVTGAARGYVGRAVENTSADANGGAARDFVLRTQDETALTCPLVPWPANPSAVACDAACRAQCEALVVARKARRLWTVSNRCPIDDDTCKTLYPTFDASVVQDGLVQLDASRVIQPTGPVLAFRAGVLYEGKLDPQRQQKKLARGTTIQFATRSGYGATTRHSSTVSGGSGIRPSAAAAFDRSFDTAWKKEEEGMRVYVPYLDGTLLDGSPSQYNGSTKLLQ